MHCQATYPVPGHPCSLRSFHACARSSHVCSRPSHACARPSPAVPGHPMHAPVHPMHVPGHPMQSQAIPCMCQVIPSMRQVNLCRSRQPHVGTADTVQLRTYNENLIYYLSENISFHLKPVCMKVDKNTLCHWLNLCMYDYSHRYPLYM